MSVCQTAVGGVSGLPLVLSGHHHVNVELLLSDITITITITIEVVAVLVYIIDQSDVKLAVAIDTHRRHDAVPEQTGRCREYILALVLAPCRIPDEGRI